jgi:LPS-assembly protein
MLRAFLLSTALPLSLLTAGAPPVQAQAVAEPQAVQQQSQPALLLADNVFITPERQLVAKGNVEAFQGDMRLRASEIIYDRKTGKLQISGPIRIDQGGSATILASQAEMDADLQNGLLRGARLVFEQQLQLASLQMTRVGGRYSQLYKTAVTSCHVCEDGRPPLWQIRARKITHDQQARQLYFEETQLLIKDVPVFYFPGLRLPDPTLKRATGFLIPSIRTTSELGTGIKVPYFIRLGDHRDLTLTPYLSSRTRTLEYRYRQAFRKGRITLEGAYTRDQLERNNDRGYGALTGWFDLPRDFKLSFDIKAVSDNAYLLDYGFSEEDRLRSEIAAERVKRDEITRLSLIDYKSLRDGENEAEIPTHIISFGYEKRIRPAGIGGELRLGLDAQAHRRTSAQDVVGRDVGRVTADVNWQRRWQLSQGIIAEWQIGASAENIGVFDDSNFSPQAWRTTPRAALTLRRPMTMTRSSGAVWYLEPIVQLGWSNISGPEVANDESNFVEFDQGNLLSLSRFPAHDLREEGLSLVYGLNWARYMQSGWNAFATVGQVIRRNADNNFTPTSGLRGTESDILLAGQLTNANGLSLTARTLIGDSFQLAKTEIRGDWQTERTNLSGTYLWLNKDASEGRTSPVSELWFDGSYGVTDYWTASANLRYDIEGSRAARAGIGLVYQNECVTVDLSLNRRYTSTTSVEPSTDFGLTISLSGFSVDGRKNKYRRSCKHS